MDWANPQHRRKEYVQRQGTGAAGAPTAPDAATAAQGTAAPVEVERDTTAERQSSGTGLKGGGSQPQTLSCQCDPRERKAAADTASVTRACLFNAHHIS